MGNNEQWERPTAPGSLKDIHYRHGLLLREVAALRERLEAVECLLDQQAVRPRRSIRPTVERIGVSAIVAGVVAGVVQGLAQLFR